MERFKLKLPIKLSWTGKGNKHESIELMTSNICAGGSYLLTDRPLLKGTRVRIDLILGLDRIHELRDRRSHIDVSGFVTRTDHQGMAICFDKNYKISPIKLQIFNSPKHCLKSIIDIYFFINVVDMSFDRVGTDEKIISNSLIVSSRSD